MVTLVSFVRDDDKKEDIAHLQQYCTTVHTVELERSRFKDGRALLESVVKHEPVIIRRDRLPQMERALRNVMGSSDIDVIHADQTSMAQYALFAQELAKGQVRPRTVLDEHNALNLVVQRQARYERGWLRAQIWRRESQLLKHYERELLKAFDEILAVTSDDRESLLQLLDGDEAEQVEQHMTVVPICVDPVKQPMLPRNWDDTQILHLGTMFWPPNVEGVLWFAREVLPHVVKQRPDVRFVIAGKNPPPEVQALRGPHVEVTGFVIDPEPLLASSRVFVVPLLAGGGMRVKILDAWQWGVPIVSTTIGAEGISLVPGENILLADEPQAFAEAVIRVLGEPQLGRRLRENGRHWVETHYNWRKVYPKIDAVYGRLGDCLAAPL